MIIRLTGGLGNQLFQWAYGRARAAEGQDVKYTLGEDMGASGYRLDRYPIDVPMATDDEIVAAGAVTHGWWEDEREFAGVAGEVRQALSKPRLSRTARILGPLMEGRGFLHIRRGDSDGSVSHAELFRSIDYYRTAINWAYQWYLFSDDPDWCEREFAPQLPWPNMVTVMDRLAPEDDLWLMSQCDVGIIANSTFSWWAAWLGPDARGGTVVAPKDWLAGPKPHPTIVPGRWRTL